LKWNECANDLADNLATCLSSLRRGEPNTCANSSTRSASNASLHAQSVSSVNYPRSRQPVNSIVQSWRRSSASFLGSLPRRSPCTTARRNSQTHSVRRRYPPKKYISRPTAHGNEFHSIYSFLELRSYGKGCLHLYFPLLLSFSHVLIPHEEFFLLIDDCPRTKRGRRTRQISDFHWWAVNQA